MSSPRGIRAVATAAASATVAAVLSNRLIARALPERPAVRTGQEGPDGRWWRTNHAGDPVSLLEGPAAVAGLAAGAASVMILDPARRPVAAAMLLAGVGSGLVGGYDDLYGSTQAKGFAGHLRALRRGELTSGMIKVAGIGLSALGAALLASRAQPDRSRRSAPVRDLLGVASDAALVAGLANLVNLFDLRPGRAGKVSAALALLALDRGSAPVLGAVFGVLPADLAGRSMLGDTGANAFGAAAGAAALGRSRPVRLGLLAVVIALTAASERVSFTAVIERTPWLRALDQAGRPGRTSGDRGR